MSFDEEPEYSFVGPSEMADLTTLFPVEPEGYVEEDPVLVVNGLAFDGSGLSYEEGGYDNEHGVPFDKLIPVAEEPDPYYAPSPDYEEEARRRQREQINDAYARADAAWSYEEAEEILDASLPEGSGLFDGGWL